MTGSRRADLLIELGVEELPAPFLARALEVLPAAVPEMLAREKLAHGEARAVGTPRRIAVMVAGVAARQDDETRVITGPPEKVAVDPESGGFALPARKFAEKFGAGVEDLRLVDGPKGRVAALTVHERGRSAVEIVAGLLGEMFGERTLPYPQSMYWQSHTGPFIRPVHWLVAMHGDAVIDAELFGIRSGRETYGHRFHDPGPHVLADTSAYEKVMRDAQVIVDPAERRSMLESALERCAVEADAEIVEDEELADEVVNLTELPVAVAGGFQERFLELPEPVIVTAMAVHQRYFALRSRRSGELLPRFVAVANTRAADPERVRRGFERVLAARLDDARFCHDEDRTQSLSDRVPALEGVVFQAGLGTYLDKARRLSRLCPALRERVDHARVEAGALAKAALLCKADLVSRVVYEFPELQGTMGGVYAAEDGLGEEVSAAIADHYRPAGPGDDLPRTDAGRLLSVADKIDTMAGFFALGRRPRGGSDPFGLRRACLGVVRILLAMDAHVTFSEMINLVYPMLSGFKLEVSREDVVRQVLEFLDGRLRVLWRDDARTDLLDAVLACGVDDVVMARRRLVALTDFQGSEEFEDLAVAFKRAHRIVRDERALPPVPDEGLYEKDEERALHAAVAGMYDRVRRAVEDGDFTRAFAEFRKLRTPVDAFFDEVYVNVENDRVRVNRLALLGWLVGMVEPAARLDLVQFERTRDA